MIAQVETLVGSRCKNMERTQPEVYATASHSEYSCEVIRAYFSGLYDRLNHEDRPRFIASFDRLVATRAPGLETQRAEYLVRAFHTRLELFGDKLGLVAARHLLAEARGYLPNYPRAAAHTVAWAISSVRSKDLDPLETGFALLNGVLAIHPSDVTARQGI